MWRFSALTLLTASGILAEKDGNNFILEFPSGITRGNGEWSVGSGARVRFFLEDLALNEKDWPRLSALDVLLVPGVGLMVSPNQTSLEVIPLSLPLISPLYRKDLLGAKNRYIGAHVYFMFLFSWLVLYDYSISGDRIVRTFEPHYVVRWNIDERYRIHEFGVTLGFWFPGLLARK